MKSSDLVRERLNAFIKAKGWSNHTPLIREGRLTNGTLGRIRKDGENIKLSTLDDLAEAMGVRPVDLIAGGPAPQAADNWRKVGEAIANQSTKFRERELLLNFLAAIDQQLQAAQRFAESIPDITER